MAVFDGTIARGEKIGEFGPDHFLESGDNLMLITKIGLRYKLHAGVDGDPLRSDALAFTLRMEMSF